MKEVFLLLFCVGLHWQAYAEFRGNYHTEASVQTNSDSGIEQNLQKFDNVLNVEFDTYLNDAVRLFGLTRVRIETTDNLEPGKPNDWSSSAISERWLVGDYTDIELRELYIDGYVGDFFYRLGKQQIVWGQADGLQVLDVVNPTNFREFILADIEQRRIGLWSANLEFPVYEWNTQIVWILDQTYHLIPGQGAAFQLTSPKMVPQSTPGYGLVVEEPDKPDQTFGDSDFGVRFSRFMNGWDIAFNYLYQYANTPVFDQRFNSTDHIVTPRYERVHLIGGSVAKAIGSYTARGEVGYFSKSDYLGESTALFASSNSDDLSSDQVSGVIGLDYNGFENTLLSGQWFVSQLLDDKSGRVRDEREQQLTLLARRDFLNQVVSVDLLLVHSLNDSDGVRQLSLSYEFRSNIEFNIGIDQFYGDSAGVFGQFAERDRVNVGFIVSF